MNQESYYNFDQTPFKGSNPLDFLLKEKSPRSSFESSDRQLEIPICDPPFIRARQDSNRSRQSGHLLENILFAAQPTPGKQMVKLDSMMERDTFADYDDFFMPPRERLPSETCMSSNLSPISALQFPEENFENSLMIGSDSLSDNLIDAASAIKDTTCTLDEDDLNMDCCSDENSGSPHDNLISNLRPVQVPTSNEDSSERTTNIDEETPEPTITVSREGKRK